MTLTIPITKGTATAPQSPIPQSAAQGVGGGLAGSLIGSAVSYFSARDTNRKAKKLAREQMRFQERMSNTAYQRAVKDMRKAGINPMLAYMQGGASAPQGASPNLRAPALDPNTISTAKNVGSQILQRSLQNENLQSTNNLIQAQTSSAVGLAKQNQAIGNWFQKHPELAPALSQGGGAGAAATGAKSLVNIVKGIR